METSKIIEYIVSIVAILASVGATYKVLTEVLINKKSKLRDEYQFVKNYVGDLFTKDNLPHPFIIEKGYLAISGYNLRSEEILKLLEFPNTTKALRYYAQAYKYVEFIVDTGLFQYRKNYVSQLKRKWLRRWYFASYFIFAFIAFMPLFTATLLGINIRLETVLATSVFMLAFISLAGFQLFSHAHLDQADYIIDEQQTMLNLNKKSGTDDLNTSLSVIE